MAEVHGVENIKKLLRFALELANQIAKTKKFKLLNIFGFVDELAELGELIPLWPQIKEEFKDLSEAEKEEVLVFVRDEFDIPNDEVEAFIEEAIALVDSVVSLVDRAKRLKKK